MQTDMRAGTVATLHSIQVGQSRTLANPDGTTWTTSFFKEPVEGTRWLGRTNLDGDCQSDLVHHGGSDMAVLAYAAGHYTDWHAELQRVDLVGGAFAENLTIDGLTEETVCIGDTFQLGQALVQVTQPRVPCWKISRRWDIADLTARVERTGRTGWYFRVLREGAIGPGQAVSLLERPHPDWTVARATRAMRHRQHDPSEAAALAALPELSEGWRDSLTIAGR